MLINWLICLLVWLHICLHIHIWAPSYCLMYPAALHIFVSAAWLMVCCQYDSPQLVPEPGGHCCQSGCCGGAHVSSSQSPKSSSCRHGFWCRDGVREEYYWGYYHTRSFQRLHIFVISVDHRHRLVSCRTSGALVLFNPNPWWQSLCGPIGPTTPRISPAFNIRSLIRAARA